MKPKEKLYHYRMTFLLFYGMMLILMMYYNVPALIISVTLVGQAIIAWKTYQALKEWEIEKNA